MANVKTSKAKAERIVPVKDKGTERAGSLDLCCQMSIPVLGSSEFASIAQEILEVQNVYSLYGESITLTFGGGTRQRSHRDLDTGDHLNPNRCTLDVGSYVGARNAKRDDFRQVRLKESAFVADGLSTAGCKFTLTFI